MMKKAIFLIVVVMMCATYAAAAPVTVVNGSFEDDILADGGTTGNYDGYAPPGWVCESGVSGVYHAFNAPDGNNAWVKFGGTGYNEQGITQVLTATLQPDTIYTYSVDVFAGNRGAASPATWYIGNELAMVAGNGLYLYGYNMGYGLGIQQTFGTLVNGAVPGVSSTNLGPDPIVYDQWYTVSMQYTSGAAGTDPNFGQKMKLFVRIGQGDGSWTAFDNVRLDATPVNAVPEPSSILALGTGALGILGFIRRNKN